MQVTTGIESCNLTVSTTYVPTRWVKNFGVKMRMTSRDDSSSKDEEKKSKNYAQVGVCAGCGLYCLASSIEFELSNAALQRFQKDYHVILSNWSPGYWQTMGSLLGCFVSGVSLCYVGRQTSLHRIALPILTMACFITFWSTKVGSTSSYLIFSSTLQIFFQNMSRSLSLIIPPIYILETICRYPGSFESRAAGVLLALTQLPVATASLVANLGLIGLDSYRALLMPLITVFGSAVTLYFAPESPRWLVQIKDRVDQATVSIKSLRSKSVNYNLNKEIEYMQREMQSSTLYEPDSCLRPLLVLSCLLLLVQLMGYGAYHFYTSWAFAFSGLTINSQVVSSLIRLCSIGLSTIASLLFPGPTCTSLMLSITTSCLTISLLVTGICMYNLEQGGIETNQLVWLPVTFLIIYQISFSIGIGTYAIPTCALITPAKSRPIIMTILITIYQVSYYCCEIFLPLMISVLHPFGVFWFHASLTAVGLVYILLVIIPELKWTAKHVSGLENGQNVF